MEPPLPVLVVAVLVFAGWFWMVFTFVQTARRSFSFEKAFVEAQRRLKWQRVGASLRGRFRDVDVVFSVGDPNSSSNLQNSLWVRAWAPGVPSPEVLALVQPLLRLEQIQPIAGGLQRSVSYISGTLEASRLIKEIEEVVAAVEKVAAAPMAEHLASNLRTGVASDVRLKSLKALLSGYPKSEETARVLNACLADHAPEVRYLALHETSSLAALESFVTDEHVPPASRLQALERLPATLSEQRRSALLGKVLDLPGDVTQVHALRVIASRRDRAHAPKVCSMATCRASAEVAAAAADTLLALGARSEPAMIGLLGSGSEAAQATAIQQLREWGTVKAVEPLLLVDGPRALVEAARSAARAIQSRLAGVEAGGISLVENVSDGGVSIAPEREKS